jgi:lycopene cyclase domain-containing protein
MTIFAVIPSLVLLYVNRKYINFKHLLISLSILFVLGIIWDMISVRSGIWHFSQNEIIGNFFGMPIEEYLFMIFVPLFVINVYIFVKNHIK